MSKKNFLQRLFKRKVSNKDYTVNDLPHNRKEVFIDVMKLNYGKFIIYGLILLIFFIPNIIARLNDIAQITSAFEMLEEANNEEQEAIYQYIYASTNTVNLIKALSYLLLSIPITGLLKIIRKHAFLENIFYATDISSSFKDNFLQVFIVMLLFSLVYFFTGSMLNPSPYSEDNMITSIGYISLPISILLGIPILAFSLVTIPIYNNKLSQMFKLSFSLLIKRPLKTYLYLILFFIPFVIHFVVNQFITSQILEIVLSIIEVLLSPVSFLLWFLYCLNELDELINKKDYKELVGKGTYNEE